jgi:hypothetical protein
MANHTIELTVTIGSTEVPASVDFDFFPGCAAWGGSRFEPATNPPEEASVTINSITLYSQPDAKPHLKREPEVLRHGLVFEALTADEWLQEKCFEHVSEDA